MGNQTTTFSRETGIAFLERVRRVAQDYGATITLGTSSAYPIMFAAALKGNHVEIACATVMAACTGASAFIEAKRANSG